MNTVLSNVTIDNMNIKAGDLVTAEKSEFFGHAYAEVNSDSTNDYKLSPDEPLLCLTSVEDMSVSTTLIYRMVKVLTRKGVRFVFPGTIGIKLASGDDGERT